MSNSLSVEVAKFDLESRRRLVEAIHNAPVMIVLAITGGGMASITDLLLVPGASRTVLEVTVPYAALALAQFTGQTSAAVSVDTAQRMARSALERARLLRPSDTTPVLGVGCTAALVTDRERRGTDRACLAIAGQTEVLSWEFTLDKASAARAAIGREAQDRVISDQVLQALAHASGVAKFGAPLASPAAPVSPRRKQ